MSVKVVSLDFWGTIVVDAATTERHKTTRRQAYAALLHIAGLDNLENVPFTFFELIDSYVRSPGPTTAPLDRATVVQHAFQDYAGTVPLMVIENLLDLTDELYTESLLPEPTEGAADFIRWVSDHWPLYLISDTYVLPGIVLDRILKKLEFLCYFRGRFYSDQLGSRKPDPLAITLIAKREGISSGEVTHIGDTRETDGQLADSAGCRTILIDPRAGAQDQGHLESNPRIAYCRNFRQVTDVLHALRVDMNDPHLDIS